MTAHPLVNISQTIPSHPRRGRRLSAASAASRLFIAGSLLALFTACAVDTDETGLGLEADDGLMDDGEVGEPPPDSETIGKLQQSLFGNDCQNADIRVVNSLPYSITVQSLEYYNGSDGAWQNEDLTNRVVTPGTMQFWTPTLGGADGEWIYSFNVNYECHGSHQHNYHINTPDQTCATGRVFLLEIP